MELKPAGSQPRNLATFRQQSGNPHPALPSERGRGKTIYCRWCQVGLLPVPGGAACRCGIGAGPRAWSQTRTLTLPTCCMKSVNHTLPSGPFAIPNGCAKLPAPLGSRCSDIDPIIVTRDRRRSRRPRWSPA